jgi:hypothetical protein
VAPRQRRAAFAAFAALARELQQEVWVDETWIDVGEIGAWRVDAAA